MIDGGAGGAEHQRVFRIEIAQHVDDRVFPIVGRDGQGAVFDVDVLLLFFRGRNARGVPLVALSEGRDGARYGG